LHVFVLVVSPLELRESGLLLLDETKSLLFLLLNESFAALNVLGRALDISLNVRKLALKCAFLSFDFLDLGPYHTVTVHAACLALVEVLSVLETLISG